MLTETQLRTARTGELEALRNRIEVELTRRELEEHSETPNHQAVGEIRHTPIGSYQWEMVNCGKDRCKKCADGKGHGPYLYRYFRRGGRLTSEYVKLSELAKHPAAPPRPALKC